MEDLTEFHQHAQQTLSYWVVIRLARLAIKVNRIEKTQKGIIAFLNKPYKDDNL
jgi:hypothetical protein